ncbi:hypothetical protein JW835_02730 [bacterium]|nr:hypothetical protein [bacterium]
MNTTKVSVTTVSKNFSDFINRVAYRGERFVLLKGNKPVAEIGPVVRGRVLRELPDILSKLPVLSKEERKDFLKDLDKAKTEIRKEKMRDPWAS